MVWPRNASSQEQQQLFTYAKARGWNILKGGVETAAAANTMIVREKGRGTFVAEPKLREGLFQELTGFSGDMAGKGRLPVSRVLTQEVIAAPRSILASIPCRLSGTALPSYWAWILRPTLSVTVCPEQNAVNC